MTDQELLERLQNGKGRCPFCEGPAADVEHLAGFHFGEVGISVERMCLNCLAQWRQDFSTSGASATRQPDKAVTNPAGHERDMQNALAKAEAERIAPLPAPPSKTAPLKFTWVDDLGRERRIAVEDDDGEP